MPRFRIRRDKAEDVVSQAVLSTLLRSKKDKIENTIGYFKTALNSRGIDEQREFFREKTRRSTIIKHYQQGCRNQSEFECSSIDSIILADFLSTLSKSDKAILKWNLENTEKDEDRMVESILKHKILSDSTIKLIFSYDGKIPRNTRILLAFKRRIREIRQRFEEFSKGPVV